MKFRRKRRKNKIKKIKKLPFKIEPFGQNKKKMLLKHWSQSLQHKRSKWMLENSKG